jgi:glycosyltransferase involved in cell wall biosynthesis
MENVHLLGMIPHDELIRSGYHRAAELFVMPSLIEVQGLALLEGQANGLVSVGMNSGGTKDLIVDGVNGFLVEPGDEDGFVAALDRLLKDDALRARMRKATLEEVKRHDLSRVSREWEEIYSELVAGRSLSTVAA